MKLFHKSVRAPAVSGRFYPSQPLELERLVCQFLEQARKPEVPDAKALVAPHAGYMFSGPIAGSAFSSWSERPQEASRIVLLGPSHFVAFPGIAFPDATEFATPLGSVPVDQEAIERLRSLPQVSEVPAAHGREHCLEVELPFLQRLFGRFSIVPLVIGDASDEEVLGVVEALWGGAETRFVLSSDLSHYHDYETARELDQATATIITAMQPENLSSVNACGFQAIRGFLMAAQRKGLRGHTLDLRNSADTAGPRHSVVGYGAFAFGARRVTKS